MMMLCSKCRLQITNKTKLQWFGPIFWGGAMMKMVACYALNFTTNKKIGPNCNGLVLFFICSRNLEHFRVPPSPWRRPVGT